MSNIIKEVNTIAVQVDYTQREYLFEDNTGIRTSDLAKINSDFYALSAYWLNSPRMKKSLNQPGEHQNPEDYFGRKFDIDYNEVEGGLELAF